MVTSRLARPLLFSLIWTFMTSSVSTQMPAADWVNQNGLCTKYENGPTSSSFTEPELSGQGWSLYGPPWSVSTMPSPYQAPAEASA